MNNAIQNYCNLEISNFPNEFLVMSSFPETKLASAFKHDYKKAKRTYKELEDLLNPVLDMLIACTTLPEKYKDHAMSTSGKWKGFRNCHIKPDLVLIYEKTDGEPIKLIRLGSHAELSL
jgi:mRNA interferase YafQ